MFVKGFFKDDTNYDGKMQLEIPKDAIFTKNELFRLKKISKEIKRQKTRFKIVPFLAVIVFVFLILGLVSVSKNILVKKILQSACQSVFQAKCDIYNLNLSFLDARLKIGNMQIADKREPMLNLFDADNILIDFNLVNLLRSKIDIENIECKDIKYHTERKVSGELPEKKKSIKDAKFVKEITERTQDSLEKAKQGISDLFEQYSPENIINEYKINLKTPEVAVKVKDSTIVLLEKWKTEPESLNQLSKKYIENTRLLCKTDINSLKNDKAKLAETILLFTDTLDEGKKLSETIKQKTSVLKTDVQSIKNLFSEMETSITNDKKFAREQINKISDFKIPDGKQLLGNTIDTAGYILLGKYYPYLETVCSYAKKGKDISGKLKTDKTNKTKKSGIKRDSGTFIYWKKDNIPKFLLEHALVNGQNFNFELSDLSSDMNRYGKPAFVQGTVHKNNITHDVKLNADFRTSTDQSPFVLSYSALNIPFSYDLNKIVQTQGVPDIKSKLNASFTAQANEKAEFTLSGKVNLNEAELKALPFEPEFANKIYQKALTQIHNIEAEIKAGYGLNSGIILDIDSNADKVLLNVLKSVISSELADIKQQLIEKIDAELSEKSKELNIELGNFNSITDKILNYETTVSDLNGAVQQKLEEMKTMAQEKTNQNINIIKEKAKDKAVDALMYGIKLKK
jgi:uncharacterized protein (TIGR03545 family)